MSSKQLEADYSNRLGRCISRVCQLMSTYNRASQNLFDSNLKIHGHLPLITSRYQLIRPASQNSMSTIRPSLCSRSEYLLPQQAPDTCLRCRLRLARYSWFPPDLSTDLRPNFFEHWSACRASQVHLQVSSQLNLSPEAPFITFSYSPS